MISVAYRGNSKRATLFQEKSLYKSTGEIRSIQQNQNNVSDFDRMIKQMMEKRDGEDE